MNEKSKSGLFTKVSSDEIYTYPHMGHGEGKQAKVQGIYTQREVHVSKEH